MADDLDDLLDEVEDKYCEKQSPKTKPTKKSIVKSITQRSKKCQLDDDISAIIDDVDDEPESTPIYSGNTTNGCNSKSRSPTSSRKCFPVYLGDSSSTMGAGSSIMQRSCNQLRCTSCDFKVVFYDDYIWHSTCDYLFLRNNVPDFQKLKAKLKKQKGSRAYACQCAWRSIKSLVDINTDHDLHWVCGKHST
ncbi:protein C8orf37-like [Anneissia japonica]|uniref:protein C8orf37-like n=1 Tax=Anneissia japonica TaxID=1529436 RepID=UPI0014258E09|nr:protein C8orf37-like [Anneissia japonica]